MSTAPLDRLRMRILAVARGAGDETTAAVLPALEAELLQDPFGPIARQQFPTTELFVRGLLELMDRALDRSRP